MNLTLAEAMAMAVIKGDMAAAYALADRLREEAEGKETMEAKALGQFRHSAASTHEVIGWPEFGAFARRLGLAWDLRTMDFSIDFNLDGIVTIHQKYQGADRASPRTAPSPIPPEHDFREYE